MNKIILLLLFTFCFIQSKSQVGVFSKIFTKQEAKTWITNNLNSVILSEQSSGIKPIFQLNDTSCIARLPHYSYIGKIPVDMNLIFSYQQIFVMNTYVADRDGTNRTELIELVTDKKSATFIIDIKKLPTSKKEKFVDDLMNAFYILADKRDLIF